MLELAFVLSGAALLTLGASALLGRWQTRDQDDQVQRWLEGAEQALWGYVQRNHRLPCVDADGDGLEDRATAGCSTADNVGGLPFRTLGIAALAADPDQRVRYGVWRQPGNDLTAPAVASTTDQRHDPDGRLDFLATAFESARQGGPVNQPQLAGMDAIGPRTACETSDVHPAAVVTVQRLAPGAAPAGGLCFSQARRSAVVSIGRFELLGRLYTARMP